MSPMAIFKMIEKRAKAAGIEKFTPHGLRRTFATRMLDVGADISIVKEAMGHSSINTSQRYDRRGFDKVRDYIRAIAI
ncbi:site-specific integrase [Parasutterella muris]|uniref:site-specific integrase n=1 Tax=Parasutterella muris TaxID=2565572 RepID=UPI00203C1D79|nr:tyrosine-type recombinase/integrase [Parasutterella muris]